MELIDFFEDEKAWMKDELFYPLRRYFGPYDNNPYDGRPVAEIKEAFLKAIYAQKISSFDRQQIRELKSKLLWEGDRFREDFGELLPPDFKVLLFPMSSEWDFVMKHLEGTWGVTFPNCVVLGANPSGNLSRLLRTLHHEANHSIRLKYIKDDHCFLDRVVLEGLAEVYVDEKFPLDAPSKYVVEASLVEVQQWRPYLEEFWLDENRTFETYKKYLYGNESEKIPRWLGYAVGYQIVKSARASNCSNISWSELIRIPAAQFIV